MIPTKVLAQATAQAVVSVALDRQHRKLSIAFKESEVTLDCGWSGDDIVMKVKKVRGMVEGMGVAVAKKKIILPPGIKP